MYQQTHPDVEGPDLPRSRIHFRCATGSATGSAAGSATGSGSGGSSGSGASPKANEAKGGERSAETKALEPQVGLGWT